MTQLSARHIVRGGRNPITRECANDDGFGHANRPLVRQIIREMKEDAEDDPRFDYRPGQQDNLEAWQIRSKFR